MKDCLLICNKNATTSKSNNTKKHPTWQYAVDATKKKVQQYDLNGFLIKTWDSFADIAREYSLINSSNIVAACKGKRNSAYGYKWKYAS